MPAFQRKKPNRITISLSQMLSDDEKRIHKGRADMWQQVIKDALEG